MAFALLPLSVTVGCCRLNGQRIGGTGIRIGQDRDGQRF